MIECIWAYLQTHPVEICGAVISFIWLYLEYKISIWLWPVGVILPIFYIYISLKNELYGITLINAYYLISSIWGWTMWYKNRDKSEANSQETNIQNIKGSALLISSFIALPLYAGIYYINLNFTDNVLPMEDAIVTTLSFIGMVWLAKKWLEHWLCWIVADFMLAYIFFRVEDYLSASVYFIYFVVAIFAYFHWKKEQTSSKKKNTLS